MNRACSFGLVPVSGRAFRSFLPLVPVSGRAFRSFLPSVPVSGRAWFGFDVCFGQSSLIVLLRFGVWFYILTRIAGLVDLIVVRGTYY